MWTYMGKKQRILPASFARGFQPGGVEFVGNKAVVEADAL